MGTAPLSLPELIECVRKTATGDGEDLDLLAAALSLSEDVVSLGDALVVHFVDQARRAGHSWTAIGVQLGVSKQAARQRFGGHHDLPALAAAAGHLPRLRACLRQAGEEARLDGSDEVGTHHQLRGLMLDGVGAAVLEKLGVTRSALQAASARLFGATEPPGDAVPPESDEARCAVAAAASFAREGGHDYVGTEHLLFVLASDAGSRSRRLLNSLGISLADVKRELKGFVGSGSNRSGRRSSHRAFTCSFCGRCESPKVRIVAGSGVRMCDRCVRLASDVPTEPRPD